jgi:hypothetical protein
VNRPETGGEIYLRLGIAALGKGARAVVRHPELLRPGHGVVNRGGRTRDLDLCDAFRGIVLGTAMQRLGGRDSAFRLLGKAAQVRDRTLRNPLDLITY